jgi:hypothetical protein
MSNDEGISAADRRAPPRGQTSSWAGGVALALVLYVLSTGPVAGLAYKGYLPLSDDTLLAIYAPVGWCCEADSSGTVEKCVMWYLEFCGWRLF